MSAVLQALADFFESGVGSVLVAAVDILVAAYLIYRVLLLVKGTRAMQIAIGFGAVYAVHLLARYIGLVTLYSMLDGLLTYIVLIAVVVFQNDIRRAFMRLSRPLFRARVAQETHVVEEVIKAATALSQNRVGAIIVFEREAALDDFIEPGTTLDSAVSKELLYSIFVPSHENPMHDGAVIIREGRVWQAGAFLPLTASPKLDRTLGTRHRAAIGISEETDAVVVVVSEERGQMSLCFNGNIVRHIEPSSLREALLGLFYPRTSPEKIMRASMAPPPAARPGKTSPSQRPPRPRPRAEETQ